MKTQILSLVFLLTCLSAALTAASPQPLHRPMPLPSGVISPTRPLPLWVGPSQVSSQMQLLLIDDQLANNQYITTLSSSGTLLPGGQQSAIFGARQRMGANRKSLTWYPHAVDKKIPVQQIYALQAEAFFEGVTDRSAHRIGFNQGAVTLPSANYVNLALSDQAFSRFTTAALGSLNTLAYKEKLQDGSEREISASLAKAATLTLQRPMSNICRPDRVNGELGQICTVRSVQVQQSVVNGGDLRFTARAKGETPIRQFRVGQRWYRLGESIAIAEFASSKAIEVFVQQTTPVSLKLGSTLEMSFYSPSRLAIGDRFNLLMTAAGASTRPIESPLSRLELLLVDDQVENNQYLTTTGSSGQQFIYGVRHPQAFGGGSRPAAWYLEQTTSRGQSIAQPKAFFNGFVDEKGQSSELGPNPRLSDSSFDLFSKMAAGDSVMLSYGPPASPLRSNIVKGGQLTLAAAPAKACHREIVDDVEGEICILRRVQSQFVSSSGGDIQFRVDARGQSDARIRVADTWRALGEPIPLAEFANSRAIEVFTPAKTKAQHAHYKMFFYSGAKAVKGDRFVVGAAAGVAVSSVSSPSANLGSDALFSVVLSGQTLTESRVSLKLTPSSIDFSELDAKNVKVTFGANSTISNVDLSSENSVLLPAGISSFVVAVPTIPLGAVSVKQIKSFLLSANMGGVFDPNIAKTGRANIEDNFIVSSVANVSGSAGHKLNFDINLSYPAGLGRALYLEMAGGTAYDDNNKILEPIVDILFDKGEPIRGLNFRQEGEIKLLPKVITLPEGASKITIEVPTKAYESGPSLFFYVKANTGDVLSADIKTGKGTIKPFPAASTAEVAYLTNSTVNPGQTALVYGTFTRTNFLGKYFVKLIPGSADPSSYLAETASIVTDGGSKPIDLSGEGQVVTGGSFNLYLNTVASKNEVDTKSSKNLMVSVNTGESYDADRAQLGTIFITNSNSLTSITGSSKVSGQPATLDIRTFDSVNDGDTLYLRLFADTASTSDFDQTKVDVDFDIGLSLKSIDLTGGKKINFPRGAKQAIVTVPTSRYIGNGYKKFDLQAQLNNDSSMLGHATLYASNDIHSISDSIVKSGEPNVFSIDLESATKINQDVFFKIKEQTAQLSDMDAANSSIVFLPSGINKKLDLNSAGNMISVPLLTQSMQLSIPTKKQNSQDDKSYILSVNLGSEYDAIAAKSGTGTIKKNPLPDIALSITPLAGEIAAGTIGAEDAKLAYKIKVDASHYTGRNMKQALLARTLRAGSTMQVSVDGPVGQGNSCSFLIENSPQAGKHALIPAYIEYAEGAGPKKVFHGCRNEGMDITAGQWNWQQDSSAQTLTGELDLTLGFVLSDSASLYTVEDPSLKWEGAARANGNLTVRAEWNEPVSPL